LRQQEPGLGGEERKSWW